MKKIKGKINLRFIYLPLWISECNNEIMKETKYFREYGAIYIGMEG